LRQFGFDHNGALDDDDVSKLLHGNRGLIVIMISDQQNWGVGSGRPQHLNLNSSFPVLQALLQELILSGTGKT
jgi:hypothetical protein